MGMYHPCTYTHTHSLSLSLSVSLSLSSRHFFQNWRRAICYTLKAHGHLCEAWSCKTFATPPCLASRVYESIYIYIYCLFRLSLQMFVFNLGIVVGVREWINKNTPAQWRESSNVILLLMPSLSYFLNFISPFARLFSFRSVHAKTWGPAGPSTRR